MKKTCAAVKWMCSHCCIASSPCIRYTTNHISDRSLTGRYKRFFFFRSDDLTNFEGSHLWFFAILFYCLFFHLQFREFTKKKKKKDVQKYWTLKLVQYPFSLGFRQTQWIKTIICIKSFSRSGYSTGYWLNILNSGWKLNLM